MIFPKSFWRCWPRWAPLGIPRDPWVPRVPIPILLRGNFFVFWEIAKIESHPVNYLTMLTLLVWHLSLAGIFSALRHIVAETPTNIKVEPDSFLSFYHGVLLLLCCLLLLLLLLLLLQFMSCFDLWSIFFLLKNKSHNSRSYPEKTLIECSKSRPSSYYRSY